MLNLKKAAGTLLNGLAVVGLLGFAILFVLAWFGELGMLYRGL